MLKEIRCTHCQSFLCYRQKGGALDFWTCVLELDRSRKFKCRVCGEMTKIEVEQGREREVALAK